MSLSIHLLTGLRDGTGVGKLVLSAVEPFFFSGPPLCFEAGSLVFTWNPPTRQSGLQKFCLYLFSLFKAELSALVVV